MANFLEILNKISELVFSEQNDSENDVIILMDFFKKIYNKDEENTRSSLKRYYFDYIVAQKYMNSISASFQMIATDIKKRFWFSMENNVFEFGSEDVEYAQYSSEEKIDPNVRIISYLEFILDFLRGEVNILSNKFIDDYKIEGSKETLVNIQKMIQLIWIFVWGEKIFFERLTE